MDDSRLLPGWRTCSSTDTQRFLQDWTSLNTTDHALLVAVVDTPTYQHPQDPATVRYTTLAVVEEDDGAETLALLAIGRLILDLGVSVEEGGSY